MDIKANNTYLFKSLNYAGIYEFTVLKVTDLCYRLKSDTGREFWMEKKEFHDKYGLLEQIGSAPLIQPISNLLSTNENRKH